MFDVQCSWAFPLGFFALGCSFIVLLFYLWSCEPQSSHLTTGSIQPELLCSPHIVIRPVAPTSNSSEVTPIKTQSYLIIIVCLSTSRAALFSFEYCFRRPFCVIVLCDRRSCAIFPLGRSEEEEEISGENGIFSGSLPRRRPSPWNFS